MTGGMIGCYAALFQFQAGITTSHGAATEYFDDLRSYMYKSLSIANKYFKSIPTLMQFIHRRSSEIADLDSRETLDMRIIDYLYELLGLEPFSKFLDDPRKAKNLAILSRLLTLFQSNYHIGVVTQRNRLHVRDKLFADFLAFLIKHGVDNYEDDNNDSIIHDQIQVMTIHQSKGLQFPVVIVGSLNHKRYVSTAQIDGELGTFYYRPPFEPDDRIAEFNYVRECYVAFSRAENLLVLTTTGGVSAPVESILRGLNEWRGLNKHRLCRFKTAAKKLSFKKKSFSVTSDVNVFEVCPAQYRFYKEDHFSPSRSANTTFGILVHQTIEDIHKEVLAGRLGEITNEMIVGKWFKVNYDGLLAQGMRPLAVEKKYLAADHILDYFNQNYDNLERIVGAEVDVSVEKHDYILAGRIDLLLGDDGQLEILDFKTQQRPIDGDSILQRLYLQLCIYAHILRERYHKNPARAYIYWTGQRDRDSAMMEFRLNEDDIKSSIYYFDSIVDRIRKGDFKVDKPPSRSVCMECDFRKYCINQGIINF